jgi:hypothetical protein
MATSPRAARDAADDIERQAGLPPEWPASSSTPLARPDLSAVPLDENVAIYDEVGQVLIMLNPSAAAVLDHCDGEMTFEMIVNALAAQHSEDLDTVRDDVWRTLRKLASIGLVAEAR